MAVAMMKAEMGAVDSPLQLYTYPVHCKHTWVIPGKHQKFIYIGCCRFQTGFQAPMARHSERPFTGLCRSVAHGVASWYAPIGMWRCLRHFFHTHSLCRAYSLYRPHKSLPASFQTATGGLDAPMRHSCPPDTPKQAPTQSRENPLESYRLHAGII